MSRYRHLISFPEDCSLKESLPNTAHASELAKLVLRHECCRKINAQKSGVPRQSFCDFGLIRDVLYPKTLTRFETFRNDFYHRRYSKDPLLGEVRDCKTKPPHVHNFSQTFGIPSVTDEPLYGLILPEIKPSELMREHYYKHDQMITSHNSYFVGEQTRRKYKPPFDKNKCYGIPSGAEWTGFKVARVLKSCDDTLLVKCKYMSHVKAHEPFLGVTFDRGLKKFPYDHTFGISTDNRDECNMQCILENANPNMVNNTTLKSRIVAAMDYIYRLRHSLVNSPVRRIYDLLLLLKRRDQQKVGFIPLEDIFFVINQEYKLRLDEEKIKIALKYYNKINPSLEIPNDTLCSIDRFWKLLHFNFPLPEAKSLSSLPEFVDNKLTSYRRDFPKITADRKTLSAKQIFNPDAQTVGQILTPNIPSSYDLKYDDFTELRPKSQLKRIFCRVFPNVESFDEIWEMAREKSVRTDDLLSVENMRNCIMESKNYNPPMV